MEIFTKNKKGFTLIELLVVVAIIGILASVVLASLSSARDKARFSQTLMQMKQIKIAAESYYSDNGSYPPDGGPGTMPAGLASYMSSWPISSCSNINYDWNNFSSGDNVYVAIRTISPSANLYTYCIYNIVPASCQNSFPAIASKQFPCQ